MHFLFDCVTSYVHAQELQIKQESEKLCLYIFVPASSIKMQLDVLVKCTQGTARLLEELLLTESLPVESLRNRLFRGPQVGAGTTITNCKKTHFILTLCNINTFLFTSLFL